MALNVGLDVSVDIMKRCKGILEEVNMRKLRLETMTPPVESLTGVM
jgi:hypothetical protein